MQNTNNFLSKFNNVTLAKYDKRESNILFMYENFVPTQNNVYSNQDFSDLALEGWKPFSTDFWEGTQTNHRMIQFREYGYDPVYFLTFIKSDVPIEDFFEMVMAHNVPDLYDNIEHGNFDSMIIGCDLYDFY